MVEFRYNHGDFFIRLTEKSEIEKIGTKKLEEVLVNHKTLKPNGKKATLSIGKTRFFSVDRRYHPSLDTPWKRITDIDFIICLEGYQTLKECGYFISEAPTGNVFIHNPFF